ncbi:MAG: hypothetical protein ABI592_01325 [Acidobacteriota bacterium]
MKKSVARSGRAEESSLPDLERESRWEESGRNALADLAARGLPFTSADVVGMVGDAPSHSLLPSLLRWGHRHHLIRRSRGAPVGTVWIGVEPSGAKARLGIGRRRCDVELNGVWPEVHERATRDGISASELVNRAVRAYLGKR